MKRYSFIVISTLMLLNSGCTIDSINTTQSTQSEFSKIKEFLSKQTNPSSKLSTQSNNITPEKNITLKSIVENISKRLNKPVIFEGEDINMTNVNIDFLAYDDVIDYINAKKLPYNVTLERYPRFDKFLSTRNYSLVDLLKNSKYKSNGTLNALNEIQNLSSHLKVGFSVDAQSSTILSKDIPIAFEGSAYDFLEQLADQNNLFFKVENNKIVFRQFDEKLFNITMTPLAIGSQSTQSITSTTSASGSNTSSSTGSSGSSSGNISADLSFSYKIYDELLATIKNVVGSDGSYHLNQASGQLFVRAKKDNMAMVKKVVDGFNETYSKIIEIKITIVELNLYDKFEGGLDFSSLSKNIEAKFKGTISSVSSSTIIFNKNINYWGASTITGSLSLMKQYGDTTINSKIIATTINTIPVYAVSMAEEDYISELTQTAGNANNAPTWSTKKSVANDGISIYAYPKINHEGKIVLTIQPKIAKHVGFKPFSPSVGSFVQTENRDRKEFSSTVILEDGGMAIIGNISSDINDVNKQGLPFIGKEDSIFDFIGGSRNKSKAQKEIIMFVSASIIK